MASNALARTQAELARVKASRSGALANVRSRTNATLDRLRSQIRASKYAERGRVASGMALTSVGAVGAGQLAKISLFPDANGVSRAPWVGYGLGAAALGMVLTGKARSSGAMMFVAFANGLVAGQLAIKSYKDWDLWPFDNVDND